MNVRARRLYQRWLDEQVVVQALIEALMQDHPPCSCEACQDNRQDNWDWDHWDWDHWVAVHAPIRHLPVREWTEHW